MDPLDKRFDKLENAARIGYLIGGFITHTLTIEEREELDAWVVESEANMQLFEDMTDDPMVDKFLHWLATRDTEARLAEVKQRLHFKNKSRIVKWWHYAAAACLIGIIGVIMYKNNNLKEEKTHAVGSPAKNDILPGSAIAELRLPGGQVIILDKLEDTIINDIRIQNGQVLYSANELYTGTHEIVIPRRGFYQLVLPDGTKVWLNSESSISYPGAFTSGKREVRVTGETYFEVAEDSSKPFVVSINGVTVQAIGTAFNINGFDSTVTLTEGIVEIRKDNEKRRLKPGDQWNTGLGISKIDINAVTAWTKNEFRFKHATIRQIMPLLERWYDCKVIYEDEIGYHFNGTIERSVPVSRVLELLEGTGHVRFIIEANTITVRK